jgi:hypothetical protein
MTPQQKSMSFVWMTLCLAPLSGCFGGTAAAQPAPKPSLTITPSSPINISGPQGGPFSPPSFQSELDNRIAAQADIDEPFGLPTVVAREGSLWVNWQQLQSEMRSDELIIAQSRSIWHLRLASRPSFYSDCQRSAGV